MPKRKSVKAAAAAEFDSAGESGAAETEEAKPERAARRSRSRQRPEADEAESDNSNGNSPFGNDGPIPAFLLRPTRLGN